MHTYLMPARHGSGCAPTHSATVAAVRPSTCASRPAVPAASTIPVCQQSAASRHRPVTGSLAHTGLPRRVSSIPSTSTAGNGSASRGATWATNAACATGHDTPYRRAPDRTQRECSAICSPHSARSRAVSRDRAGTADSDSVNVARGHSGSRQHHRVLCHRSRTGAGPWGRSRGRVVVRSFTEVETTPQAGQAAAASSSVTISTTRAPSSSRTTDTTLRPSIPNSTVAASSRELCAP